MDQAKLQEIHNKIQAVLDEYNVTLQITQGITFVPLSAIESPYNESLKEN